jgi:hypothetical protein
MEESVLADFCRGWNIIYSTPLYHIIKNLIEHDSTPIIEQVWNRQDLFSGDDCLGSGTKYDSIPFEQISVPLSTIPLSSNQIFDLILDACTASDYVDGLKATFVHVPHPDYAERAINVVTYTSLKTCEYLCDISPEFAKHVSSRAIWYWSRSILQLLLDNKWYVRPDDPNVLFSACMILADKKLPEPDRQLAQQLLYST